MQVQPIKIRQPQSLLTLLWNLSLFFLAYWIIFYRTDIFSNFESENNRLKSGLSRKPLFDVVFSVANRYAFPISFLLNLIYFYALSFTNSSLTVLLDTFQSALSRKAFAVVLLFDHSLYVVLFHQILWKCIELYGLSQLNGLINLALTYCSYYILHIHNEIILYLMIYFKYFTLLSIRQLRGGASFKYESIQIQAEIRKYAKASCQLNQLLSVPFALSIFLNTLNMIIVFCFMFTYNRFNMQSLFYTIQYFGMLMALCLIGKEIDYELSQIAIEMKDMIHFQGDNRLFKRSKWPYLKHVPPSESMQIYCRQSVQLYRKCYQLRLFNLCSVDLKFLFCVVLFGVNYIVLITETTV